MSSSAMNWEKWQANPLTASALKLPSGWIYAQGITHYTLDEHNRLLMAGLGPDGKLAVALEISETPFAY